MYFLFSKRHEWGKSPAIGRRRFLRGVALEGCKSDPSFETIVLVARERNISLDATIFPNMVMNSVSKTVVDFFAGKSEAEEERYIAICKQAEALQKGSVKSYAQN